MYMMMSFKIPTSFSYVAGWAFGLITLLALSGCTEAETNTATGDHGLVYVETHRLEPAAVSIPVYVIGRVSSATSFDLSFRTGGFIEELLVNEGDRVRKGQLLAAVNRRETDAAVLRARNLYNKSLRDLSRLENLFADDAATLQQLEDQKTLRDIYRAELDVALFNQERASIVAPADGIVLQKRAEINEQVGQGQVILRLGQSGAGSTVVMAGVSDRDVQRLQIGDGAQFTTNAYPGKRFHGKISRIASEAHARSAVFEVEITLENAGDHLRNGFIVSGKLLPSDDLNLIPIPISALVEADGLNVWIYVPSADDRSAERLSVRPLHIGDDSFFVSSTELNGIERVITRGSAYLRPGSYIATLREVNL